MKKLLILIMLLVSVVSGQSDSTLSGNLSGNAHWRGINYTLTASINCGSYNLIIDSGAVFKGNYSIIANGTGTITINGTLNNKVTFTSINDNTVGGTYTGSSGTPLNTDGTLARVVSTSGNSITATHVVLKYLRLNNVVGIGYNGSTAAFTGNLSNITLRNCTAYGNAQAGIIGTGTTGNAAIITSFTLNNIVADSTDTTLSNNSVLMLGSSSSASSVSNYYSNARSVFDLKVDVTAAQTFTTNIFNTLIRNATYSVAVFSRGATALPTVNINNFTILNRGIASSFGIWQYNAGGVPTVNARNGFIKLVSTGSVGFQRNGTVTLSEDYVNFDSCATNSWQTLGSNDITNVHPTLSSVQGTIKNTFVIPNGFSSGLSHGSSTFGTLSIDTTVYTNSGWKQATTDTVFRGILYQNSAFASVVLDTFKRGTTVDTLQGSGFGSAPLVYINRVSKTLLSSSSTQITFADSLLPKGYDTIVVHTAGGQVSDTIIYYNSFVVGISAVIPDTGRAGQKIRVISNNNGFIGSCLLYIDDITPCVVDSNKVDTIYATIPLTNYGARGIYNFKAVNSNGDSGTSSEIFTYNITVGSDPYVDSSAKYTNDFKKYKFGAFFCWCPTILFPAGAGNGGTIRTPSNYQQVDTLYKAFNPTQFNAGAMADLAVNIGARYSIFTTKHHAGFSMYDSRHTTYDIMATPYGKDVTKMFADSMRSRNMPLSLYYALWELYNPNYTANDTTVYGPPGYHVTSPSMRKYADHVEQQVGELINKYNPFYIWFDAGFASEWENNYAEEVFSFVKRQKPGILVNDRFTPTHALTNGSYDIHTGFENRVMDWTQTRFIESVWSIPDHADWFWTPTSTYGLPQQYISELMQTMGFGGSYGLDITIDPTGVVPTEQRTLLGKIGAWVVRNGKAIYETVKGPFNSNYCNAVTKNGNKTYYWTAYTGLDTLYIPQFKNSKVLSIKNITRGSGCSFVKNAKYIKIISPAPHDTLGECYEFTMSDTISDTLGYSLDSYGFSLGIRGQPLTDSATYTLSSGSDTTYKARLMQAYQNTGIPYCFTTNVQANPYIIIDLKAIDTIQGIKIVNAQNGSDMFREKKYMQVNLQGSMTIWTSVDGVTYDSVWSAGGRKEQMYGVILNNKTARYVKVGLNGVTASFALKYFQIFGKSPYIEVDDFDKRFKYYGNWGKTIGRGYSDLNDSWHFSGTGTDSVTFDFYGSYLHIRSEKYISTGTVTIKIDGVTDSADAYNATQLNYQTIYKKTNLSNTWHHVNYARKGTNSYIGLDAVQFLADSNHITGVDTLVQPTTGSSRWDAFKSSTKSAYKKTWK